MRQAINNNPIVQIAVLGGLALIVAVFFMTSMNKGSSDSSSTASSAAPAPAPAGPPAPARGRTAAGSAAVPSAPPAAGTVAREALVPGPGLPKPVATAWKRGDTVVLLVVRQGGIDDRLVHGSARSLSGDPGVS